MTTETINCTPTWQWAMKIYIEVLENGTEEGKKAAKEELMNLAKAMDKINAERQPVDNSRQM